MILDAAKLQELIRRPFRRPGTHDLRRDGGVIFIGGELPTRETLETVYDSHSQQPAELMVITFGGVGSFHHGEEHARQLKKNFHVHLMGRFDYPAPLHLLERAYASGIDLVDIPLPVFDSALARERGLRKEERLAALTAATGIFPAWGTTSTLLVGEEACCATVSAVDALLKTGIIPLPELSPRAERYPRGEIEEVLLHLAHALKKRKVATKPLMPLLSVTTPLAPAKPAGVLKVFIDRLQGRRLLAASELRRSLRVRQVEESFESAGL